MKVKLINVCDVINGGAWTQSEYTDTDDGIGVIKVSNLKSNGIEGEISYLPVESLSKYEKHILDAYDLVVTTVGSHAQLKESAAGRSFIIPKDYEGFLLNQNAVCIRPKNGELLDKRYLGYFGQSEEFRHYVQSLGRGAANQMRIAIGGIKKFEFELPPLPTQRRIAAILSAYDDLIENNLKRIRLLEEAAQNIYREWFVHFRFPGHEQVEFGGDACPPNGREAPVGWEMKPFSEVVQINPRTSVNKDVNAPYVPMASLSETSMIIDNIEERIPKGGAKFVNGDTLFARITPCLENGKTGFVQFLNEGQVATGSTEFIVFRETKKVSRFFIYCTSREYSFRQNAIKSMSGSDGRQRVKPKAFERYYLAIPTPGIMDEFASVASPLFKQIQTLIEYNSRLKEARDILLPRLMNRTIEV